MSSKETPYQNSDQLGLFKCIVDFVHSLREAYGKTHHCIELYALLLEKTGILHQEPLRKHIQLFYEFVSVNQTAILQKNMQLMEKWDIVYSDKVYIQLKEIFMNSDDDDKAVLWDHLLTLLAVLVPTSQAKNLLISKQKKKVDSNMTEDTFLTGLMEKVGSHIDPSKSSDPAEMMSGLMNSGLFNELVHDMNENVQNGNLDIGKMMGSLQGMLTNISNQIPK